MTQLEQGDEIVYMVPNYLQIYHLARSFGIEVKVLPIRQELGWQWDPDELRSIVSSNTKNGFFNQKSKLIKKANAKEKLYKIDCVLFNFFKFFSIIKHK